MCEAMIFRAPAGHHLLSRLELERLKDDIFTGNTEKAQKYIEYCLEEVSFYDEVRKMTELKKMYKEDGDLVTAQSVEDDLREKVRKRQEASKLIKASFLF